MKTMNLFVAAALCKRRAKCDVDGADRVDKCGRLTHSRLNSYLSLLFLFLFSLLGNQGVRADVVTIQTNSTNYSTSDFTETVNGVTVELRGDYEGSFISEVTDSYVSFSANSKIIVTSTTANIVSIKLNVDNSYSFYKSDGNISRDGSTFTLSDINSTNAEIGVYSNGKIYSVEVTTTESSASTYPANLYLFGNGVVDDSNNAVGYDQTKAIACSSANNGIYIWDFVTITTPSENDPNFGLNDAAKWGANRYGPDSYGISLNNGGTVQNGQTPPGADGATWGLNVGTYKIKVNLTQSPMVVSALPILYNVSLATFSDGVLTIPITAVSGATFALKSDPTVTMTNGNTENNTWTFKNNDSYWPGVEGVKIVEGNLVLTLPSDVFANMTSIPHTVTIGDGLVTFNNGATELAGVEFTFTPTISTIAVTGVTLDKTSLTLKPRQTETLTATVAPDDAANKNVTWSSSDASKVSVSEGVVKALDTKGTVDITVTTEDGNKTATCSVTIQIDPSGASSDDNTHSTTLITSREDESWSSTPEIIGSTWTQVDADGHFWYYSRNGEAPGTRYEVKDFYNRTMTFTLEKESEVTIYAASNKSGNYFFVGTNTTAEDDDEKIAVSTGGATVTLPAGQYYIGSYEKTKNNKGEWVGASSYISRIVVAPKNATITLEQTTVNVVKGNTVTFGYTITPADLAGASVDVAYSSGPGGGKATANVDQPNKSIIVTGNSGASGIVFQVTLKQNGTTIDTKTFTVNVSNSNGDDLINLTPVLNTKVSKMGGWTFDDKNQDDITYTADKINSSGLFGLSASTNYPVTKLANNGPYQFTNGSSSEGGYIALKTSGSTGFVDVEYTTNNILNTSLGGQSTSSTNWEQYIEIDKSSIRPNDRIKLNVSAGSGEFIQKYYDGEAKEFTGINYSTACSDGTTFTITQSMYNQIPAGGKLRIYINSKTQGENFSVSASLASWVSVQAYNKAVQESPYIINDGSGHIQAWLYTDNERILYVSASRNLNVTFVKFVPKEQITMTVSGGYDKTAMPLTVPAGTIKFKITPNMAFNGTKSITYTDLNNTSQTIGESDLTISGEGTDNGLEITINKELNLSSNQTYTFKPGSNLKCSESTSDFYIYTDRSLGQISVLDMPDAPEFNIKESTNGAGYFHVMNFDATATYYYTTDGSTPTLESNVMNKDEILPPGTYSNIKMIAVKNGAVSEIGVCQDLPFTVEPKSEYESLISISSYYLWKPGEEHDFGLPGVKYNKETIIDKGHLAVNASSTRNANVTPSDGVGSGELCWINPLSPQDIKLKVSGKGKLRFKAWLNKGTSTRGRVYFSAGKKLYHFGSHEYYDLGDNNKKYMDTNADDKNIIDATYCTNKDIGTGTDHNEVVDWTFNYDGDSETILYLFFNTVTSSSPLANVNIMELEWIPEYDLTPWGVVNKDGSGNPIIDDETKKVTFIKKDETKTFNGSEVGNTNQTLTEPTVTSDKYLLVNATSSNNIKVNASSGGYTFMSTSTGGVGYLTFWGQTKGLVKVYAKGTGKVSLSAGTAPRDQWVDISSESEVCADELYFFNHNETRYIFVGATEGVTVTKVEWTPSEQVATSDQLVPVITTTVWKGAGGDNGETGHREAVNRFGGYAYPPGTATAITEAIINPGYGPTPANTMLIYGQPNLNDDGSTNWNYQTNFAQTGNLSLVRSSQTGDGDEQHLMEFKVASRGVVRLIVSGNGPSGRTARVSRNKHNLQGTAISNGDHPAYRGDKQTSNDQEHYLNFVRNQHSSYHEVYFYFDGINEDGSTTTKDNPQSLFVWNTGGVQVMEVKWMPDVDIADVTVTELYASRDAFKDKHNGSDYGYGGELCPENCLAITSPEGNILLNPMASSDLVGEGKLYAANNAYNFYATINTLQNGHLYNVTDYNKTAVWTTSQHGRSGSYNAGIILNTEDDRSGFDKNNTNTNPAVSKPHCITVAQRKVDNVERNSWGIVYVVAGTREGNRVDPSSTSARRVEVAGPAEKIVLDQHVISINRRAVDGEIKYSLDQFKLTANPQLYYWDVEKGNQRVRIKVKNPEAVRWYYCDKDGNKLNSAGEIWHEGDELMTSSSVANFINGTRTNPTVDHANDYSSVMMAPEGNGTVYVMAEIQGVEYDPTLSNPTYSSVTLYDICQINVATFNEFQIVRVKPGRYSGESKEALELSNVSVISPIVFEVIGTYPPTQFSKKTNLPAVLTDLNTNQNVVLNGDVRMIDPNTGDEVEIGGIYFIIYDVVKALKNNLVGHDREHMNFGNRHSFRFDQDLGSTVVLQRKSIDIEDGDSRYFQQDFNFTTVNDNKGVELETFVYNVSQRSNAHLNDDVNAFEKNKGVLLHEHIDKDAQVTNYEQNKHFSIADYLMSSYSGNHRSYLNISNLQSNKEGTYLSCGDLDYGYITLSPYNTQRGDDDLRDKIHSIEINCNPATASGSIEFNNETPLEVGPQNNYTVYWGSNDNPKQVRDVSITVSKGVLIDQIKVTYYSALRQEKALSLAFKDANDFTYSVDEQIILSKYEDNDDKPLSGDQGVSVQMEFRQKNERYFYLRDSYERYTVDDSENRHYIGDIIYNGNQPKRIPELRTLVIHDDKEEPCEMYFFTKDNSALITSVELVYEVDDKPTDTQGVGNGLPARNVFCTSDPRFNPNEGYDGNLTGYPFRPMDLEPGDYDELTLNANNTDPYGFRVRKLVYRPESPTNFVSASLDRKEEGFVFVRKVIVRYETDMSNNLAAKPNRYILNTPHVEQSSFDVDKVKISTQGIKLHMPTDNDVKKYLIKRTSTQNNISSEVVLAPTEQSSVNDAVSGVTLNDNNEGYTSFKHQKFYTVRMLDEDRMVLHQLGFHTVDNAMPVIASNGVTNVELRSQAALPSKQTPITITTTNSDGHEPNTKVIVWTYDGSAPSVTFDEGGRDVISVNGQIGIGTGVTLSGATLEDMWGRNSNENAIVIKALAMPLKGTATGITPGDFTDANKTAINSIGTYGETSRITRANYMYVDDNSFLTSAKRDGSGFTVTLDEKDSEYNMSGAKFHGALSPSNQPFGKTFTYGGYELYKKEEGDPAEKWHHEILTNDVWSVKGNDLTPYRGVRWVVGGDSYTVSELEPLNEYAIFKQESGSGTNVTGKILPGAIPEEASSAGLRMFKGEFDLATAYDDSEETHYKTWNLPCYGDYFQFEAPADGTLTVYVKQQGVLEQEETAGLDHQVVAFRPVYILDEAGNAPNNIKATTMSNVSGDWMTMNHTETGESKHLVNDAPANLVNLCKLWINKNTCNESNDVEYGDRAYRPQGVINLASDGTTETVHDGSKTYSYEYTSEILNAMRTLFSDDIKKKNGYLIVSAGYVRYDFDVKAGKTYFVFQNNGNLGFCSYTFQKDPAYANGDTEKDKCYKYTMTRTIQDMTPDGVATELNKLKTTLASNRKACEFTLERNFYKGKWAALVLPFSVGKHQLREVFGHGVRVSHFDKMEPTLLTTRRHVHQMIVAGTPVLILPDREYTGEYGDCPVFKNVTIEKTMVDETVGTNKMLYDASSGLSYVCEGSFGKTTIHDDYWYMNQYEGKFAIRRSGDLDLPGTRVWLKPPVALAERVNPALITSFYSTLSAGDEDSDKNVNAIDYIFVGDGTDVVNDGKVYNLKGQLVRNNAENLENLPKGVYIINGVKQVVK